MAMMSGAAETKIRPLQPTNASLSGTKFYIFPLILITCLFFLWGMANNLNDILIRQFKKRSNFLISSQASFSRHFTSAILCWPYPRLM